MSSSEPMDTEHAWIRKLPLSERVHVAEDKQQNWSRVDYYLTKLEQLESDTVDIKDVRFSTGVIESYIVMKYGLTIEQKSRIVNTYMSLLLNKIMSSECKVSLIKIVTKFVGDKKDNLVIKRIAWQPFWDEILSILGRELKLEQNSADGNLSYVNAVRDFLYESRRYHHIEEGSTVFAPNCFDDILRRIELNLADTRSLRCLNGALEAVYFLPDDFPDYDRYLPRWVEIWSTNPSNMNWDFWWIKIFCRARKFTKTFDWSSLFDMFMSKVLQYSSPVEALGGSYFPRGIPVTTRSICPKCHNLDTIGTKELIISKLCKLIYFISFKFNPANSNSAMETGVAAPAAMDYPPSSCNPHKFPTVITAATGETTLMDACPIVPGYNASFKTNKMNKIILSVCRFLETNRHFFSPSNQSNSACMTFFLCYMVSQILRHKTFLFSEKLNASVNSISKTFDAADKLTYQSSGIVFSKNSICEASTKYFLGFCCGYLLELLFGRNSSISSRAAMCIRNICLIDSSFVHLFMPHMLVSLDISSVSQTHLLSPSLSVIDSIIKHFVYPDMSLLIKYIPSLLRLLLPGLDSNDHSKTNNVVGVLNNIFTNFTIQSNYSDVIQTFRGAIAGKFKFNGESSNDNDEVRYYFEFMKCHKDIFFSNNDYYELGNNLDIWYNNLSAYWIEFLSAVFDRIVLFFQAFEPPANVEDTVLSISASKYSEQQNSQMNLLNELFLSMLESIQGSRSEGIREAIENKIIDFVEKCSIYKAGKLIANMISKMVYCNPSSLQRVLRVLIDKDLIEQTIPREKLSFRLQIIGAACRMAGSKFLVSIDICQILKPFFAANFIEHREKSVRKATVKLIKDCFRGLMGFYFTSMKVCPEISLSNTTSVHSGILAHPLNNRFLQNNLPGGKSFWNEPDKDTAHYAVKHLKILADNCMSAIRSIVFTSASSSSSSTSGGTAFANSQVDQLSNNLILLTKLIIAASDLLGDDFETPVTSAQSAAQDSDSIDQDRVNDKSLETLVDYSTYVSHSGRENLLYGSDTLDRESQDFLKNLRKNVMSMLFDVMSNFYSTSSSKLASKAVATETSAAAGSGSVSVSVSGSVSSLLYNNRPVMFLWMRLLSIVTTNREGSRMSLSRPGGLWFYKDLFVKEAKYYTLKNGTLDKAMKDRYLDYCYSLNISMRKFQNHVAAHHRDRVDKFSLSCGRLHALNYKFKSDEPKLEQSLVSSKLFFVLSVLCGHEYDDIRKEAISTFHPLTSSFLPLINDIIYDVINVLKGGNDRRLLKSSLPSLDSVSSQEKSSITTITNSSSSDVNPFSFYSGCMNLLYHERIFTRIRSNWNMSVAFMEAVINFDHIESKIKDNEEKLKISVEFMKAFKNYSHGWRQNPLPIVNSGSALLACILDRLVAGANFSLISTLSTISLTSLTTSSSVTIGSNSNITSGLGIRQSCLLMFLVLHLTGHCDIESNVNFFKCVVYYMNQGQKYPSHSLALAVFFRMIYRIYRKNAVSLLQESGETGVFRTILGERPLSMIISHETIHFLRDYFMTGKYGASMDYSSSAAEGRKSAWTSLFKSIMYTKDTSNEDSETKAKALGGGGKARWSFGVDDILSRSQAVAFLVLNRRDYFPLSSHDTNIFSHWFDTENAVLIESLICSKILFDNEFLDMQTFEEIFRILDELGSGASSVNELRCINCTKAEIFAGFYRSYRKLRFAATRKTTTDMSIGGDASRKPDFNWDQYGNLLCKYYESNFKKCSKDYGVDWIGAIYFALSDSISFSDDNEHERKLVRGILNDFSWIYEQSGVSIGSASAMQTSADANESEENITSKQQSIALIDAIVYCDFSQFYINAGYNHADHLRDPSSSSSSGKFASYTSTILDSLCAQLPNISIETILSPYSVIREKLSQYLLCVSSFILEYFQHNLHFLDSFLKKLHDHFKVLKEELQILLETVSDVKDETRVKSIQNNLKYLYELCSSWFGHLFRQFVHPMTSTDDGFKGVFLKLFELNLEGCGCHETDVTKRCSSVCMLFVSYLSQGRYPLSPSMLQSIVLVLEKMATSTSYQTRQTSIDCIRSIFVIHNTIASVHIPEFNATCKKRAVAVVLDRLVNDSKLEVQLSACYAMIAYLSHNSYEEMRKLATSYTNNCESLFQREIAKKKLAKTKGTPTSFASATNTAATTATATAASGGGGGGSALASSSINRNIDKETADYMKNILMASCVILRYPYDVPDFLPALLGAYIKHEQFDSLVLEQIKTTIQHFKRSHSDRWKEYETMFSRDFIEDLQGSGSCSYFG